MLHEQHLVQSAQIADIVGGILKDFISESEEIGGREETRERAELCIQQSK